tara:strand:- start:1619 stop:1858 length:240 start_codon:yes stop_codon:yes gene_type:complete
VLDSVIVNPLISHSNNKIYRSEKMGYMKELSIMMDEMEGGCPEIKHMDCPPSHCDQGIINESNISYCEMNEVYNKYESI